jgi:hypothetical protein
VFFSEEKNQETFILLIDQLARNGRFLSAVPE